MPVVAKIRPLKDQPNLVVGDFSANQGILWLIKSTDSKTDRVMLRQLDEDAAAKKKLSLAEKRDITITEMSRHLVAKIYNLTCSRVQ